MIRAADSSQLTMLCTDPEREVAQILSSQDRA